MEPMLILDHLRQMPQSRQQRTGLRLARGAFAMLVAILAAIAVASFAHDAKMRPSVADALLTEAQR
ncbi:hypothetical protein FY036_05775 [Mesorhizobium microcysteis]|uniref:Uncharacterized protein n=1 Tax=Neoaquamicrobium microcysteis TaxID=2682781 RepID=A0A5D4GYV5_9HYPH|nr:hypothetical protein [Mesorhizobium microcysteis]TYR34001.1 hypothetical protein FY036_05775 [Mesorhizobium microcysteis]